MLYIAKFILKTYTLYSSTQISLEYRLVEADSVDEAKIKIEQAFLSLAHDQTKQENVLDLEIFEIIR